MIVPPTSRGQPLGHLLNRTYCEALLRLGVDDDDGHRPAQGILHSRMAEYREAVYAARCVAVDRKRARITGGERNGL